MLAKVDIETRGGQVLTLPIHAEDGIVVNSIEGLGPVKATLVSSSFAGQDGAQHHSSRREARTIKFDLGFEADYINDTVQDLRDRVYSFLMPMSEVKLRFYQHDGFRQDIVGVVETCEPPMFSEEPKVEATLMCFKPDFLDPVPKVVKGFTGEDLTAADIQYDGTVDTGIEFKITPNRPVGSFTIYHVAGDGILRQLDYTLPLLASDELTITTVRGAKSAILKRAGTVESVVYGVSPQSKWIEFSNGMNEVRVYASGGPVPWQITRTDRYGGL